MLNAPPDGRSRRDLITTHHSADPEILARDPDHVSWALYHGHCNAFLHATANSPCQCRPPASADSFLPSELVVPSVIMTRSGQASSRGLQRCFEGCRVRRGGSGWTGGSSQVYFHCSRWVMCCCKILTNLHVCYSRSRNQVHCRMCY